MIIRLQNFLKLFSESFLAILKVILLTKYKKEVKFEKRSKACLILGNGPSLEETINNEPEFLSDKDLICVNHFPVSDLYEKVRPHYYITVAPDLWLDDIDQHFIEQSDLLFKTMASKTNWKIGFLVPFEASKYKRWKVHLKSNPNIQFIHYNNIGIEGWKFLRHFFFRKTWAMPRPHNVIIAAIYNAINLGYSEIYLWGTEHNQFKEITVDENNRALINQIHFYDRDSSKYTTLDKRGKGSRRVHEILFKFMVAFRSYFILKDYAESRNVRIINSTPGSLIDAFERKIPKDHDS